MQKNFLKFIFILAIIMGGVDMVYALDAQTEYKVDTFIYEGADLLKKGEKARALARFKSALKLDPENSDCYFWLGLAYSDLQNYGVAAKNAEAAVSLNSLSAKAWLLWGQSLMYEGRYADAVEKLAKAFRLDPDSFLAAYNIGRCYYYGFEGNKKVLARKFFKKSWELNENFLASRYYQGLCELDESLLPLAVVSFRWILEKDRGNIPARLQLAAAYRKDNHVDMAEKELLTVLSLDQNVYDAHLQLGHIYILDKPSRKKALYHLNKFVELAPVDHPWLRKVKSLLDKDSKRREG